MFWELLAPALSAQAPIAPNPDSRRLLLLRIYR